MLEGKKGVTMFTDDVSQTVLELLDKKKVSWPKNSSERYEFLKKHIGKVWNCLLKINIDNNVKVFSGETEDVSIGNNAWDALGDVLMLIIVLEDVLKIDITPLSDFTKPKEFSTYKKRVRSKVR